MSNAIKNSKHYMLMAGDPYSREKTNKQKRREALKMKEPKVTDIRQMKTSRILLYVAYKHRVGLLVLALVLSWVAFIVTRTPATIDYIKTM